MQTKSKINLGEFFFSNAFSVLTLVLPIMANIASYSPFYKNSVYGDRSAVNFNPVGKTDLNVKQLPAYINLIRQIGK